MDQVNSSELSLTTTTKKKPWEHPWSVEEMKKGAEHWSLASDVGLFLHMQEFSQKLILQTHEIEEQVNSLDHDAKLTNIRLQNVFNDFVMLANTQFMENRVYDEEVVSQEQTDNGKKVEEKTPQQKEMELIPKIKQAISYGLNVFDSAYEKVDVNIANSESEDEESTHKSNIIFEPKDPYLHRPLPFLIGSEQFFHSDNLGLTFVVEEQADEQESDHVSDVEVETPKLLPPSAKPDTTMESDSDESGDDLFAESEVKIKPAAVRDEDDDDDDEIASEDEETTKTTKIKNPLGDLQSELARKLGGSAAAVQQPPKQQGTTVDKGGSPSAKPRTTKPKSRSSESEGNLFGTPAEEPDDDIFSRPSRLFTGRPTLFDDEEDESGGLFGSKNAEQKTDKASPAVTSAVSKPEPQEFGPKMTSTPQVSKSETKEEKPAKKGRGLFDEDDEEDDDDLFAKKPTPASRSTKDTKKPATALFGDEEEEEEDSDIFSNKRKSSSTTAEKPVETSNKPKIPAGAVSIFGMGDNLFKAAISKSKKEEEDTDEASERSVISDKPLSKPSAMAKSLKSGGLLDAQKTTPGSSSPSTVSNSSLFAEDPELFASVPKPKSAADPSRESSQEKSKPGLSLFTADEDDDDLFATMSKPAASTAAKSSGVKQPEPKKATKFLFDDEDEDSGDLFAMPKSTSNKDEKKNITLIEEAPVTRKAPEVVKAKEPPKEQPAAVTKQPVVKKVSLFSGSDDEEDLFATAVSKSPAKTKATSDKTSTEGVLKSPGAGRSLFDDDDFLFGAPIETPSVDLFKSPYATKVESNVSPKVVTSTPSSPEVKPSSAASPIAVQKSSTTTKTTSKNLFGSLGDEDDDDDLFSKLKTKPSEKSKDLPKTASKETPVLKGVGGHPPDVAAKAKVKSTSIFDDDDHSKENPLSSAAATVASPTKKTFDDPLGFVTEAKDSGPKSTGASATSADKSVGKTIDSTGKDEHSPVVQSISPPKVLPKAPAKGNKISQLQASINIDPTAHMPNKIKTKEPEESVAADFSVPASTSVLHSLAKDRAKLPNKRRPPTRRHVESQNGLSDGFFQEQDKTESVSGQQSISNVQKTRASNGLDDPFGDFLGTKQQTSSRPLETNQKQSTTPVLEEKKAASNLPVSTTTSTKPKVESSPLNDNDSGDDDLFSSSSLKPKQNNASKAVSSNASVKSDAKNETTGAVSTDPLNLKSGGINITEKKETSGPALPKLVNDDDIFGVNKGANTAPANQSLPHSKHENVTADAKDDLFGGPLPSTKSKAVPETTTQGMDKPGKPSLANSSKIVDDDDDDLFGSKSKTVMSKKTTDSSSKESTNKEASSKKSGGAILSSDDDDIFSTVKKVSTTAPVKETPTSSVNKTVKDDDDDIFASSSLVQKGTSKTSKQTKPKSQFPADDDDDIFANVPPASSKTKKPVSSKQPTKEQVSDEDDLFASSRPTSSRPAYKKPVTKDEDLFRDDTDIFADVPSVKSKEKKSQGKDVRPTQPSTFASDSGDIFAEAAASTTRSAASKPATSVAKPMDDDDDIFQDPLNVLRK